MITYREFIHIMITNIRYINNINETSQQIDDKSRYKMT